LDSNGRTVAPGVYLYRYDLGRERGSGKLIVQGK
jgi:hypothetical protein